MDTRLHRGVASTVLADTYGQDGDRLSRFTREAQVLAECDSSGSERMHSMLVDRARKEPAAISAPDSRLKSAAGCTDFDAANVNELGHV